MRMFLLMAVALMSFLMSFSTVALAQTAGGSCSGTASGGSAQILSSGKYIRLICDGTTWQEQSLNDVGSSTTPATTVQQIGNDSGSCTAVKKGRMRYNGTATWEYCNGTAWTSFELAPTVSNLYCWGSSGDLYVGNPFRYIQIAFDIQSFCGINGAGAVICYCAGDDRSTTFPGNNVVKKVTVGFNKACIIKADGTLTCRSRTTNDSTAATKTNVADVAVRNSGDHVCIIKTDGTVECWGDNSYGETTVPGGITTASKIAVGFNHSCILKTDTTVQCWGQTPMSTVPGGLTGVVDIVAAAYTTCARKSDNTLVCWGNNSYGTLYPPSGADTGVLDIAAGAARICSQTGANTVKCWGNFGGTQDPATYSPTGTISDITTECAISN